MVQDKAQFADNGYPLVKNCNAVLDYLWASLRARREAVSYKTGFAANGCSLYKEPNAVDGSFSSRLFAKQDEALR